MKFTGFLEIAEAHIVMNKKVACAEWLLSKIKNIEAPAGLPEPVFVCSPWQTSIKTDKWPAEAGCALAGEIELLTGLEFEQYTWDNGHAIEYYTYKDGVRIDIVNTLDSAGCKIEWDETLVPGHYVKDEIVRKVKSIIC